MSDKTYKTKSAQEREKHYYAERLEVRKWFWSERDGIAFAAVDSFISVALLCPARSSEKRPEEHISDI